VSLEQGQVITSLAELVATAGVAMTHDMFAIYDKNLNLPRARPTPRQRSRSPTSGSSCR
jgi:hypothetical protein